MTERTQPPFRADHVGSLLRPQKLRDARDAFARKTLSREELTRVEDETIREVIKLQEEVGLKLATDGEFRRKEWHISC